MKTKIHLLLFFSLMCCAINTVRADVDWSAWSVKGFGTLAATGSDDEHIGFYRDKSQVQNATGKWALSTDSRLGLQVDWRSDALQATVQWVARDHEGNFFEQNLDWAFLGWHVNNNLDIRVGRLGFDVFLLSDYRNVGYAYLWMRPPHEFYSGIPMFHFDGADITQKFAVSGGRLAVKLFGGYSLNQVSTEIATSNTRRYDMEVAVAGGSLRYEFGNWQTRLGYSHLQILSELPTQNILSQIESPLIQFVWPSLQQLVPALTIKNSNFHYGTVGVAYDDSQWLGQFEASYTASTTSFIPPQAQAYLSLGKRFSTLTLYTVYGVTKNLQKTVNVPTPAFADSTLLGYRDSLGYFLNNNGLTEQSISAGLRWDFHEKMAFKAQWSHYWLGHNNSSLLWHNYTPHDQVNVMSVGIDFVF
jgi:hypothetical protein